MYALCIPSLGNNAMMTRSAFQGGSNSPPYSPARAPTRVYASVAEMKRSRGKVIKTPLLIQLLKAVNISFITEIDLEKSYRTTALLSRNRPHVKVVEKLLS